jgi:hypothetical protein
MVVKKKLMVLAMSLLPDRISGAALAALRILDGHETSLSWAKDKTHYSPTS